MSVSDRTPPESVPVTSAEIKTPVADGSVPAAPITPASSPGVTKPMTWPEWFGFVDLTILVCVLIAAFGAASFAAKNSDLWYHLASGRLMTEGKYTFGVDPFSYMTEGRYWVNHNWLWDRLAYAVYQMDVSGAWLVTLKAIAFASSFLIVVLIRRPGGALWPWAAMVGLAVLASCTLTHLRPFVFNLLFLATSLFVLFRLEWKEGSWRNPIILAVLFGIWANVDSCFVLGPVTVLFILIGEYIQAALLKGRVDEAGAFGPPPPKSGLIKALILSIACCTANPHHFHVWQFPTEMGFGLPAAGMINDSEMFAAVLEPYSSKFWENPSLGQNLNGAAYLLVFVISGLSMAISFSKIRISHLLVWLLFAYLSLHQWYFILPFSIVAVMISGGYFNLLSSGIVLKTFSHPMTRVYLITSAIGRLFCIVFAVIMVPAAWPGWLHTSASSSSVNLRRVAWVVEPDNSLVQSAKTIQEWRQKGLLKPDDRGFASTIDFANYLAYFAPDEKVFANGRFAFHATEIPDMLSSRQPLYKEQKTQTNGPVDLALVRNAMEKAKAKYLIAMGLMSNLATNVTATIEQTQGWTVWLVSGRGLIAGPDPLNQLTYNPARELFGESVTPLPEIATYPPPLPRESWLDDFLNRPKSPPSTTEDSLALFSYANFLQQKANFDHDRLMFLTAAAVGPSTVGVERKISDDEFATAVLALRAARKSQAENPDLPEAYFSMSQIYAVPFLIEVFGENPQMGRIGERRLQQVTALQRYLARTKKPEQCTRYQADLAYQSSENLVQIYYQTRQLDYCRELIDPMKNYFLYSQGQEYKMMLAAAGQNADEVKAVKAKFEARIKRFETMDQTLEKQISDSKERLKSANLKGVQKFQALIQMGLPKTAIAEFEEMSEENLQKEYGQETALVAISVIDLLMHAGKVERAAAQLDRLQKSLEESAKNPRVDPAQAAVLKYQILDREFRLFVVEGNYRAAADALERSNAGRFTPFSPAVLAAAKTTVLDTSLVFGYVPFSITKMKSMEVNGALAAESEFAYSRAALAVLDGRPTEAKERFIQALSPQGVKGIPYPWVPMTERFITMIDRARKK